jgi:hypothetical protein
LAPRHAAYGATFKIEMDDFGNDLMLYWRSDLRLLLASDQSQGAYGHSTYVGKSCFMAAMVDV